MRIRTITLILLSIVTLSLSAQTETKRSFWDHGVGKFLKNVDNMVKKMEHSGFDTTYVQVPQRDRMVYLGGFTYMQHYDLHLPIMLQKTDFPEFIQGYIPSNMSDLMFVEPRFRTLQSELELGIDWRGITIEIPISITNKYSTSFGLAKNGSQWGFRIKYKKVKNVTGKIYDPFVQATDQMALNFVDDVLNGNSHEHTEPVQTQERDIENGTMDLKTFYTEAYYVFNNKKFSLSAGMFGDMIQKKSAGSLIAMANYFQSQLGVNNMLDAERDVFRNQSVSLGLGYGYNVALMRGKLCLHGSIIPMFALYNHITHKMENPYANEMMDEADPEASANYTKMFERYHSHFYDAVDVSRDSGFRINGFVRFAANYSFDRYIISLLMNYRRYMFCNSAGTRILNQDADAQLNFGFRF